MDLKVLLIFFSMYISCLCVSVLNLFLFDFVIGFIYQKKVYCIVLYCSQVRAVFGEMTDMGTLGLWLLSQRPSISKAVPTLVTAEDLAEYEINIADYIEIYHQVNTALVANHLVWE